MIRRSVNVIRVSVLLVTGLLLVSALATVSAQQPAPKPPPKPQVQTPAVPPTTPSAQGLTMSPGTPAGGAATSKPPGDRASQERRRQVRIFPPENLAELEGPDRELWQKPDQIMDALAIADGSIVADLGAGGGWFTVRLARRVGPQGIVYAEDIQEQMLESIERRMQREGLRNVRTVLGKPDDPNLPNKAHAVLIVDVFHEVENQVALLKNIREQLAPNGRLGIIEFRKDGGGPGPPMEEREDETVVLANAEAAGLRLISRETFLPYQFLLVFGH